MDVRAGGMPINPFAKGGKTFKEEQEEVQSYEMSLAEKDKRFK